MTRQIDIDNARKALPYLVYFAQNGETTVIAELAALIGVAHQYVPRALIYLRDEICRMRELPEISVLVLRSVTMKPGLYFTGGGAKYLNSAAFEHAFEDEKEKVFAFDKWDDLLKKLKLKKITSLPD